MARFSRSRHWTGDGAVRYVATSRLTVSAVPVLVYQDGTFAPAWTASAVPGSAPTVPSHEETQVASGGSGAYRDDGADLRRDGSASVFHFSRRRSTTRRRRARSTSSTTRKTALDFGGDLVYTESRRVSSRPVAASFRNTDGSCSKSGWSPTPRPASRAEDFRQFDGPACPARRAPTSRRRRPFAFRAAWRHVRRAGRWRRARHRQLEGDGVAEVSVAAACAAPARRPAGLRYDSSAASPRRAASRSRPRAPPIRAIGPRRCGRR